MGLDADSRVRLKRLSRDRLALERSFPGEQPPPGLRPVETQMLRLQQAVGNQAVTGFVHSPTSTPEERFAALIHILYSSAWVEARPDFVAALRDRMAKPIPAYAERLHYLASEGHDAWDQLPAIAAPTLVIHGSDDRLNPTANAPLLAERIPGAELYIVQGGRHAYFEEFREEASRVVIVVTRSVSP